MHYKLHCGYDSERKEWRMEERAEESGEREMESDESAN